MKILRQELQSYFDRVYPYSTIDSEHTLGGQVHIRFELGGDMDNGTMERVRQATDRALAIFNDTFPDCSAEIFVLIYEYPGENIFNASNEYVHRQFPADRFSTFYNQLEIVHTPYFTKDKNGNDIVEKEEVRVIIGKLPVQDIHAANILNGIANTEMGFTPAIAQRIFFFDPVTDRACHMYDDRGCFVWSNTADAIRDIYIQRNDWIVEYHRSEIDAYFQ
jgi:hypothetical protein